jgi:hypothetical protein
MFVQGECFVLLSDGEGADSWRRAQTAAAFLIAAQSEPNTRTTRTDGDTHTPNRSMAAHEQPVFEGKRDLFVSAQIDNEKYLRAHPEIHALFAAVTRRILLNRPHDVVAYATNLLASDDVRDLVNDVK